MALFGRWPRTSPAPVSPGAPRLTVRGTMLTHPGYIREHNEDVVAYREAAASGPAADRDLLAIVADGMGGHAAGEVASRLAADTLLAVWLARPGPPPKRLAAGFRAANQAILALSRRDPACAGMGTTCTVLAIEGGAAYLGHIGDSRAYLWRAGVLEQISRDHSLVAQLVREGRLTPEEAAVAPDRNIVLKALGTEAVCKPDIAAEGLPVRSGDVFLLCSDGLSDLVADGEIADALARLPPFEACETLIGLALAAGGTDNISVGVFAIAEAAPADQPRVTRPLPAAGGAA